VHPASSRPDHTACSGCSLCLLVCPVWRQTHDIRLTPHGRAKALQHGATAVDVAASIDACTLCGACDPVCPENIDLVAMVLDLRADLARPDRERTKPPEISIDGEAASVASVQVLPDQALGEDAARLARVMELLHAVEDACVAADSGSDIALALAVGAEIPRERLDRFIAPLQGARRLIVGEGMLFRPLRAWLPGAHVTSLGEALSSVPEVRDRLGVDDLYVIEPRAYHADYERLVKYYDALRVARGCGMNLDLQRIAIPATAAGFPARAAGDAAGNLDQARWVIEGRNFTRIIVEDLNDLGLFKRVSDKTIVHLCELASPSRDGSARPGSGAPALGA